MPCFTKALNRSRQPIIAVGVIDASAESADVAPVALSLDIPAMGAHALLDSGANRSCISAKLAAQLNLQPISDAPMTTVSQKTRVRVYRVRF